VLVKTAHATLAAACNVSGITVINP
jgi:hypothetical protein